METLCHCLSRLIPHRGVQWMNGISCAVDDRMPYISTVIIRAGDLFQSVVHIGRSKKTLHSSMIPRRACSCRSRFLFATSHGTIIAGWYSVCSSCMRITVTAPKDLRTAVLVHVSRLALAGKVRSDLALAHGKWMIPFGNETIGRNDLQTGRCRVRNAVRVTCTIIA